MASLSDRAKRVLPRKGKVPNPIVSDDQTHEVMSLLDVFCTWAFPGAPWLEALVDEAARLTRSLLDRNLGAYAWARRDLLRILRDLDRNPDPVPIPSYYPRDVDPVEILRSAVACERRTEGP